MLCLESVDGVPWSNIIFGCFDGRNLEFWFLHELHGEAIFSIKVL